MVTAGQHQQRREDVARNMRRLLADQDRTAYWLARRVGVSDQTMSRWMNAHQEPTKHLEDIADVLGCSIAELYHRNGDR